MRKIVRERCRTSVKGNYSEGPLTITRSPKMHENWVVYILTSKQLLFNKDPERSYTFVKKLELQSVHTILAMER